MISFKKKKTYFVAVEGWLSVGKVIRRERHPTDGEQDFRKPDEAGTTTKLVPVSQ